MNILFGLNESTRKDIKKRVEKLINTGFVNYADDDYLNDNYYYTVAFSDANNTYVIWDDDDEDRLIISVYNTDDLDDEIDRVEFDNFQDTSSDFRKWLNKFEYNRREI